MLIRQSEYVFRVPVFEPMTAIRREHDPIPTTTLNYIVIRLRSMRLSMNSNTLVTYLRGSVSNDHIEKTLEHVNHYMNWKLENRDHIFRYTARSVDEVDERIFKMNKIEHELNRVRDQRMEEHVIKMLLCMASLFPNPEKQYTIDDVLIGIEWEPQLSIKGYFGKAIFVNIDNHNTHIGKCGMYGHQPLIITHDPDKVICLFVKPELTNNCDTFCSNLEFRTNPVKLTDLPAEIKRVEKEMITVIENIAKDIDRDIGVFLPTNNGEPRYCCYKHINLSLPNNIYPEKDVFHTKDGDIHSHRHHYRVSYDTNNYEEIINTYLNKSNGILTKRQDKPIFLGYTNQGIYRKRESLK